MSSGRTSSEPGSVDGAQHRVHLAAEAAAGDEHEALAALGELVGELHRDPAAERVADDRRAVVAERDHRVADGARVGAERVVAARLGRLAVAEQVRRQDVMVGGEMLDRRLPLRGAAGDPVDEDDQRPFAAPGGSRRGGRAARSRWALTWTVEVTLTLNDVT